MRSVAESIAPAIPRIAGFRASIAPSIPQVNESSPFLLDRWRMFVHQLQIH